MSSFSAKLSDIRAVKGYMSLPPVIHMEIVLRYSVKNETTGEIHYIAIRDKLSIDNKGNLHTASYDKIHDDDNDVPSRVCDSEYELAREHPTDVKCHCYDFEEAACGSSAIYSSNSFALAREIAQKVREFREKNIDDCAIVATIREKYC